MITERLDKILCQESWTLYDLAMIRIMMADDTTYAKWLVGKLVIVGESLDKIMWDTIGNNYLIMSTSIGWHTHGDISVTVANLTRSGEGLLRFDDFGSCTMTNRDVIYLMNAPILQEDVHVFDWKKILCKAIEYNKGVKGVNSFSLMSSIENLEYMTKRIGE